MLARLEGLVGRPLEPLDWHVTLCFLGRIDAAQLAALRAQAEEVRASRIELRFEALEYWPQARLLALVALARCRLRRARSRRRWSGSRARPDWAPRRGRCARTSRSYAGCGPRRRRVVIGRLPGGAVRSHLAGERFHLAESIVPELVGDERATLPHASSWPLHA